MYSDEGLLLPYLQGSGVFEETQLQLHEELLRCLRIDGLHDDNGIAIDGGNRNQLPIVNAPMNNLAMASNISEYDLGGDLFKAPEPILEEHPLLDVHPFTTVISMMSSSEDIINAGGIQGTGMETVDNKDLLDEVFYDCKKDLVGSPSIEELFSELSDVIQELQKENDQITQTDSVVMEGPIQKSESSGSLDSKELTNAVSTRPEFQEFQEVDLGALFGMRRAYSEGDIMTLGIGSADLVNTTIPNLPVERLVSIENHKVEERRQKLSRYMKKKTKRNFDRKIKYACRKALADSQPRVRGRFAKTEEHGTAKSSK